MEELSNPDYLVSRHGSSPLDAARTLAFSAVAAGPVYRGRATLDFTVGSSAGIKKHMCVYIASGAYTGIWRIAQIVSATVIRVYTTVVFSGTVAGTFVFSAHLAGFGFYVDVAPVTIADISPFNANEDTVGFIATTFIAGVYYPMDFKHIRISAGRITVVRRPPPPVVSYIR